MRKGFFDYINEADQESPSFINDALDPARFIHKHFGEEGIQDPDFLFKDVIEIPAIQSDLIERNNQLEETTIAKETRTGTVEESLQVSKEEPKQKLNSPGMFRLSKP